MILLDGPSGAGKSTLLAYLREHRADRVKVGTKYTTRPRRAGDNDWEFHFVEALPDHVAGHIFHSVTHSYAVDLQEALEAHRHGQAYCISCTDLATTIKLRRDHGAWSVYIARPLSDGEFEALLEARGTVSASDAAARREERRTAGREYVSKLGQIDHVILNDGDQKHLFAQMDAILDLREPPGLEAS